MEGVLSNAGQFVLGVVNWANDDPITFFMILFLFLLPMMFFGLFLSARLMKEIKAKEKAQKKATKLAVNTRSKKSAKTD